ncbi:hypothetical protein ACFYWS_25420 [Streptomyces sp. NPDC002795]|uniref:hypothetical protein n=1 Tax=Streptomyces sp. NPDC002795 TaxID=3364665 RepID=UPI0036B66B7A
MAFSPGAGGSRFALTLGSADVFSGALSQDTDLPPGSYRFTTVVRTQGGLEYARVRITGAGRESYVLDLNNPTQGWEELSLGRLRLASGHAAVSIEVRGRGGQSVSIDSLSLIRETV